MRSAWCIPFLFPFMVLAQDRCAVSMKVPGHLIEAEKSFEQWVETVHWNEQLSTRDQSQTITRLPVVFHIIHNGEPVGEGINLAEDRVLEQIEILNNDYRRLNSDTALTPGGFRTVAADTQIEFVLAKRNPEGLPTSGIVRQQGSLPAYSTSQFDLLKAESFWPPEEYLNVHIADLSGGILGWAEFPYSDLAGIEEINSGRDVDGVIVDYQFLGINDNTGGSFESFGRTLTHEIGHFLGLRHPWGDVGACNGTDYCDDTPQQSPSYSGTCPSEEQNSCGSSDMFSNYMNWTDDACMNLFTECQRTRMRIILNNSPRRKSLKSSPALETPIQVENDLGIREILSPMTSACSYDITPSIELRNYGTNAINAVAVSLYVNDQLVETVTREVNLDPLSTLIMNFSGAVLPEDDDARVSFRIESVNGTSDGNTENDIQEIVLPLLSSRTLPHEEGFESRFESVTTYTFSGAASKWQVGQATYFSVENQAAIIDLSEMSNEGELDYLLLPVLDLSALTSAQLNFSYAYAGNGNTWNKDGFIVAVSEDCGQTFTKQNYLFEAYGDNLATTESQTQQFAPATPSDWERRSINITQYAGRENLRIAFIGINSGGNKLYLDSILIESTALKAYDIGIRSLTNLPVVTCTSSVLPAIEVRNYGFEEINNFTLSYTINGMERNIVESNLSLTSGAITNLQFPISNLEDGVYDITFSLSSPNSQQDEFIANDTISRSIVIDNTDANLPIRQNFEAEDDWLIANATGSSIYARTNVEGNGVLRANAFESTELGNEHWFVSPILNTNSLTSLGLTFKYAYRSKHAATDRVQVLLSTNCGDTYQYSLFDKTSGELNPTVLDTMYVPRSGDWVSEFIDLQDFAMWRSIRIAFVFTNGNGNNLYLDDIEFLDSNNPDIPRPQRPIFAYPNPAEGQSFDVVFNLPQQDDVVLYLMNMSGQIVTTRRFPYALNQVIPFETPARKGVYFLRVVGTHIDASTRIVIAK